MSKRVQVSKLPDIPLMIYDGECRFCCKWIARWEQLCGEKITYKSSQECASEYPEIPEESFDKAVQLVDVDGTVYSGAEAVLRALSVRSAYSWTYSLYNKLPALAKMMEFLYAFVASQRYLFSVFTNILWGRSVEPPTYIFSSWLFIRAFGLIVIMATASYWSQADGLIGSEGILPAKQTFEAVEKQLAERHPGESTFSHLPNIFLYSTSDEFIDAVFLLCTLAGLCLVFGLCPLIALLLIWFLYSSLMFAGQQFLTFQWDILLLQTAFLSLFFAPWKLRDSLPKHPAPILAGRMLLWLTLICLMFQSGIVKLQSFGAGNINTWRDLTALNFHYWTQPLPIASSWYIHHLPLWVGKLSLVLMMNIELVFPFLLFGPRRVKNIAIIGQVLLQLLIILSGNYGYFNLLTIVLCIPFIDDQSLPQKFRERIAGVSGQYPARVFQQMLGIPVAAAIIFLLGFLSWSSCYKNTEKNLANQWISENKLASGMLDLFSSKLHAVSGYGLFRVMTTTRPEIIIYGSHDQKDWKEYDFKYKPVDLKHAPVWVIPHMPRLDWQMWFEGLNYEASSRVSSWFVSFLRALSYNQEAVLDLLKENPFPEQPPKYFKIELHHYEFTSPSERSESGNVWNRKIIDSRTAVIPVERVQ